MQLSAVQLRRNGSFRKVSLWASLLTAAVAILAAVAEELRLSDVLVALLSNWRMATRWFWEQIVPFNISQLASDALTLLALCVGIVVSSLGRRLLETPPPTRPPDHFRSHYAILIGVYFFASAYFSPMIGSPIAAVAAAIETRDSLSTNLAPIALQFFPFLVALVVTADGIHSRVVDMRAALGCGILFALPIVFGSQEENSPLAFLLGTLFYVGVWSTLRINAAAFPRVAILVGGILSIDFLASTLAEPFAPLVEELMRILLSP